MISVLCTPIVLSFRISFINQYSCNTTISYDRAKTLCTVPIVTLVFKHSHNPVLFFLLFWHREQVYWESQISCISLCALCHCSLRDLRGVCINIVNQAKQRLCQWCKQRELNLLQFTARSSSANLTVQEIKSLLSYSICLSCTIMREIEFMTNNFWGCIWKRGK